MSKHPYCNAFKCHLWRPDTPCLCPAWLEVVQQPDSSASEPARQVKGCAFQMLPWLISGPIVKSNQALLAIDGKDGLRRDVQELRETVVGLEGEMSELQERLGGEIASGLTRIGLAILDPIRAINEAARSLLPAGDARNAVFLPTDVGSECGGDGGVSNGKISLADARGAVGVSGVE